MDTSEKPEIQNQKRITNIIYISLIFGLLLFFIIAMILMQDKKAEGSEELDRIFTFLVPLIGLVIMFISRLIYNKKISKYDSTFSLLQKISYYRTAKIISWAMIEGGCFLALVATILTSNYLYVVVFIFLFGYFLLLRPSNESMIRDMRLNSEESDLILKS